MKSHQEKFVTAVVLTLTIALFSTNFLKAEEQVQAEKKFDTVITTHVQSLWIDTPQRYNRGDSSFCEYPIYLKA